MARTPFEIIHDRLRGYEDQWAGCAGDPALTEAEQLFDEIIDGGYVIVPRETLLNWATYPRSVVLQEDWHGKAGNSQT